MKLSTILILPIVLMSLLVASFIGENSRLQTTNNELRVEMRLLLEADANLKKSDDELRAVDLEASIEIHKFMETNRALQAADARLKAVCFR